MHALRNIATSLTLLLATYLLTYILFSPEALVHFFILVTAIDHWHPNWAGPEPALLFAHGLMAIAAFYLLLVVIYWFTKRLFPPANAIRMTPEDIQAHQANGTTFLKAIRQVTITPEDFQKELYGALLTAGLTPDQATSATKAGMALADTKDPKDWAGPVRDKALDHAGVHGRFMQLFSTEPRLVDTAQFLTDYGYSAMPVTRYGTDEHHLNFDGILIKYNTTSFAAEESLIELLTYAHQAHMASVLDNGKPKDREQVENYSKALAYVATKLSLRGFVPPELDSEIGRDGTATADELQRWAIAQVVATCSPISRDPLTPTERTIPEEV